MNTKELKEIATDLKSTDTYVIAYITSHGDTKVKTQGLSAAQIGLCEMIKHRCLVDFIMRIVNESKK